MARVKIAVDITRSPMISTGRVHPVATFVDGRPVEGGQERDKNTGMPLWSIDCLIDSADETQRSEAVGVRVPAPVQPVVAKFQPVPFVGLVAVVGTNKAGGLSAYWSADDIASATSGRSSAGRSEAAA